MNLIEFKQQHIIASLLETVKKTKSKIRVWQDINSTHQSELCLVEHIDTSNKKLHLHLPKHFQPDFNLDKEIFFHSKNRSLLFKSTILEANQEKLEIHLPSLVKIEEARGEYRVTYGLQSEHYAHISFLDKNSEKHEAKLRILDLSQTGISLVINKYIFDRLPLDEKVHLRYKNLQNETKDEIFIVRHKEGIINKIGLSDQYKIGLELFYK